MRAWLETVRRKRLAALGAGVGLLLGLWVLWSLFVPHRDPIVEAIRKQGYPVCLEELDAYYPSVPAEENAALIYTKVFALLTNCPRADTSYRLPSLPVGHRLPLDEVRELKDCLAKNQAALRLLYSVPPSARSRYPVRLADGFNTLVPHLSGVKEAVAWLRAEGLLHATEGDAEKATQAFLAAGRVAESLGDEPLIISQWVRYVCWAGLLSRLECALSLTTFTDSQLAALQKLVASAERPRAMARAMAAERAVGLSAFADRKGMPLAAPQAQGLGGPLRDFLDTVVVCVMRAAGFKEKDRVFFCDTMAKHIAALELPYPARAAAGRQCAAFTTVPSRFHLFSQMHLPVLVSSHRKDAGHVANVRVATAALAIERFRLTHTNALPASLEQLAPDYCESVPADPFDGKPLRYKTHGASYAVYSIGSDGRDDGGVVWDSKYAKVPQDVAFVVKH